MNDLWKIDAERHTATHTLTGLVIKFTHQADGKIDGRPIAPVPAGIDLGNGTILLRQANDAYLEAMLGDIQ